MALLTFTEAKEHLGVTNSSDDEMLTRMCRSAATLLGAHLGFDLDEEYPDGAPDPLLEAGLMLISYWYDDRRQFEAATQNPARFDLQRVPGDLPSIIDAYRVWSF